VEKELGNEKGGVKSKRARRGEEVPEWFVEHVKNESEERLKWQDEMRDHMVRAEKNTMERVKVMWEMKDFMKIWVEKSVARREDYMLKRVPFISLFVVSELPYYYYVIIANFVIVEVHD